MARRTPFDCYWSGTPEGYKSPIIYSSTQRKLVDTIPSLWTSHFGNPSPWPRNEKNTVTVEALDELLFEHYGLPLTGLKQGS
jgi:hypothetical protein